MKIFKLILIITGILLFLNIAVLAICTNFNSGLVLVACTGSLLVLYGMFAEKLVRIKWITAVIISSFSLILCFVVFLAVYGNIDNAAFTEDAVIVLGAGSIDGKPAPQLAYRLDKAAEYHEKNPEAVIIVSGGRTEALVMEKYLIEAGVLQEKILRDENSTDTYENFVFSKQILDEYFKENYNIVFITNNFHIFRSGRIAKALGIEAAHFHAKLQWYDVSANYLRECGAVVREILLGRMF